MTRSLGVALPQFGELTAKSADELRAFLELAEGGGFDSVWLGEGLLRPAPSLEPLATLAFAAACTERIRLGVATLILPLHEPVQLAKTAATIDWLSEGRLILAVSVGIGDGPHEAFGSSSSERRPRMEEYVAIMRRLWDEDVVEFEGEFRTLRGLSVEPKPVQNPFPLWFGGSVPAALRRAARLGDGWIGSGTSNLVQFREQLERLRGYLSDAARDPASFSIAKRAFVAIERTPEEVQSWFTNTYGAALTDFAGPRADPREGDFVAIGDTSYVTERLLELRAAGADVINVHPIGGEEHAQVEALLSDVVPILRES